MWILSSVRREFLFLYLPGLMSVVIAILFPRLGESSIIYAFLATALIDSGHVYTTSWRTIFHPEEFSSSRKYLFLPALFFSVFFLWHYLGIRGLWSFVVYATLFHHIRQVYGFSKWYQALNKRPDKASDYFLYALALLPILTYHFRENIVASYYNQVDLFLFPDQRVVLFLSMIYLLVLGLWIIREVKLWRSGTRELNRLCSVAFPSIIYGYCFLVGETHTQVLFPLLFIHGVAYVGVMGQTLERTRKKRFKTFGFSLLIVGLTAALFGFGESWMEENVIDIHQRDFLMSAVIGLWLTPLFCHYYFDSLIWKKNHRESKATFGPI